MQMFSSSRKTEPAAPMAPTPPPPQQPAAKTEPDANGATISTKAERYRAESRSRHGEIPKGMLIDCEVEGRIDSQGRLTVGKQARIKGDIKTRSVIVDGNVNGNITAEERCELRAGCTVNGDIEAPRLVV